MRKFLTTTVLAALAAAPAAAGPLLEGVVADLSAEDAPIGLTTGGMEMDGETELYADVVLTGTDSTMTIDALRAEPGDNGPDLYMRGIAIEEDGTTTTVEKASVISAGTLASLTEAGHAASGSSVMAMTSLPEPVCAALASPVAIDAAGVTASRADGSTMTLDGLSLEMGVDDPAGLCVLEMAQSMSGFEIGIPGMGGSVSLGTQTLEILSPMGDTLPTEPTGETYVTDFSLGDLAVAMGGAEQVTLERLAMTSSAPADSLVPLGRSGYMATVRENMARQMAGAPPELSPADLKEIWSGVRASVSSGAFEVTGLEIVGGMPMAFSGNPALEPGRSFDGRLAVGKAGPDIEVGLEAVSPDLFELALGLDVIMQEMTDETAGLGPDAMMMAAPVALTGFEASISDHGIGALAAQQTGTDPYEMIGMAAASAVGPEKGDLIANWAAEAKDGTASIAADPEEPLPLSQLTSYLMGDWATLGEVLGIE